MYVMDQCMHMGVHNVRTIDQEGDKLASPELDRNHNVKPDGVCMANS